MKRKLTMLVLLAGLVGGAYGFLVPAPSVAQTGYRLDVDVAINPGAGLMNGSNGWLTCGWHTECVPPFSTGDGLDWDNIDNGTVYWRSWGWRSDGCDNCQVATTALWISDTSACYRIQQDIIDWFGYYRGTEYYTHTTTQWDGYTNPVTAGAQRWLLSEFPIGYSPATEKTTGCAFSGSHTHQYSSVLTQNSYYPTASQFNGPYREYPVRANGYWQHDLRWYWQ